MTRGCCSRRSSFELSFCDIAQVSSTWQDSKAIDDDDDCLRGSFERWKETNLHYSILHEQHIDHWIPLNMSKSWSHKEEDCDFWSSIDECRMDDQYGMLNQYNKSMDQNIVHSLRNVDTKSFKPTKQAISKVSDTSSLTWWVDNWLPEDKLRLPPMGQLVI